MRFLFLRKSTFFSYLDDKMNKIAVSFYIWFWIKCRLVRSVSCRFWNWVERALTSLLWYNQQFTGGSTLPTLPFPGNLRQLKLYPMLMGLMVRVIEVTHWHSCYCDDTVSLVLEPITLMWKMTQYLWCEKRHCNSAALVLDVRDDPVTYIYKITWHTSAGVDYDTVLLVWKMTQ